jgi:NAD(P)-dependent dehydrogenase (short-subunit alcohol dehydrogenase family)
LNKLLDSKRYLLLGGDGNLGPMWAQAILQAGGEVFVLGLSVSNNQVLKSLKSEYGSSISTHDLDLTDLSWEASDFSRFGKFDGLVLNAGIDSLPGSGHTRIEDFDWSDWENTFKVNVFGNVQFLNKMLPSLNVNSSVVVIGSIYSVVSPNLELYSHYNENKGSVKNPAYAASKSALISVVRQYATHLAPQSIRVNMLSPGGVMGNQDHEFIKKFRSRVPSRELIPLENLGGHLLYLLSNYSRNLTGQNILVDDGYSSW